MSARRQIIAALSEDSYGGIATLQDVDRAEDLVDALVAEVRREDAAYIVAIQERVEADEIAEHGSLDHESELQGQAVRTMAAHLRAEAGRAPAGEEATAPAATATPTDTNRRARLLHEMDLGARWKSGDVVAWYERQGLTGLGVRAARHDLATLRDSGAITQHDEKGVRFYTRANLNTRKDVRP